MARSVSTVSAKLVADAEKFVSEFRRAERQAQRTGSGVTREVDRMAKSLSRKFSVGDIGKDLLRGFGLGSGFAVAQSAADQIVSVYEQAAKNAEAIEASTAATWAVLEKQLAKRRTPEQELNLQLEKQARLYREIEQLKTPRTITRQFRGREGDVRSVTTSLGISDEANEQVHALTKELQALDDTIKALQTTVEARKPGDKWSGTNLGLLNASLAIEGDRVNAQLEEMTGNYRDLVSLATEAGQSQPFFFDAEAIQAAATATAAVRAEQAQQLKIAHAMRRAEDEAAEESARATNRLAEAARDMGWAFESSFESAIVQGEKLSDVMRGLLQDIMRIALRAWVTAPLGGWLGGLLTPTAPAAAVPGYAGAVMGLTGRASGGPVSAGQPYMVGEEGPELIVPRSSGTVIPNHALGGGGTVNHFMVDMRGASVEAVARLEALVARVNGSIEPRSIAAMMSHRARGAMA